LQIRRGETLGIVGESGCGKSTLAQLLMGMLKPSTGHQRDKPAGGMQMVFQDPLARPACRSGASSPSRCGCKNAAANANAVSWRKTWRCRWAFARNISTGCHMPFPAGSASASPSPGRSSDPDIIVLDEPTSALDISVQAQILNLLVNCNSSAI
jgi:peptide/nickel transport system ATP-binding protein